MELPIIFTPIAFQQTSNMLWVEVPDCIATIKEAWALYAKGLITMAQRREGTAVALVVKARPPVKGRFQ